jgi:hypothetical protein
MTNKSAAHPASATQTSAPRPSRAVLPTPPHGKNRRAKKNDEQSTRPARRVEF